MCHMREIIYDLLSLSVQDSNLIFSQLVIEKCNVQTREFCAPYTW